MTIEETQSAQPTDAPKIRTWPRHAGFWRRLAALMIDYLVVFIPLFILVAALFSATNGGVTGSFSLRWNTCYEATLNGSNDPSASNYDWQLCRTSIFGLTVAQWVQGSPKAATQSNDSSSNSSPFVAYSLDSEGNVRSSSLDVGFVEWIALFVYLLLMEMKSGEPIGKRIMAITVRDDSDFDRVGLLARKAVRRQGMKFLGFLPMILLGAWYAFQSWGDPPEVMQEASSAEVIAAVTFGFVAMAVALIWLIWIAASILLGGNPIHDRFAETSVRVHPDRD